MAVVVSVGKNSVTFKLGLRSGTESFVTAPYSNNSERDALQRAERTRQHRGGGALPLSSDTVAYLSRRNQLVATEHLQLHVAALVMALPLMALALALAVMGRG